MAGDEQRLVQGVVLVIGQWVELAEELPTLGGGLGGVALEGQVEVEPFDVEPMGESLLEPVAFFEFGCEFRGEVFADLFAHVALGGGELGAREFLLLLYGRVECGVAIVLHPVVEVLQHRGAEGEVRAAALDLADAALRGDAVEEVEGFSFDLFRPGEGGQVAEQDRSVASLLSFRALAQLAAEEIGVAVTGHTRGEDISDHRCPAVALADGLHLRPALDDWADDAFPGLQLDGGVVGHDPSNEPLQIGEGQIAGALNECFREFGAQLAHLVGLVEAAVAHDTHREVVVLRVQGEPADHLGERFVEALVDGLGVVSVAVIEEKVEGRLEAGLVVGVEFSGLGAGPHPQPFLDQAVGALDLVELHHSHRVALQDRGAGEPLFRLQPGVEEGEHLVGAVFGIEVVEVGVAEAVALAARPLFLGDPLLEPLLGGGSVARVGEHVGVLGLATGVPVIFLGVGLRRSERLGAAADAL